MVIYYVTCASPTEAKAITIALLERKLVACVRQSNVQSSYWWGGEINHAEEVLLMMEGVAEKFSAIESTIAELHSYDEFVLTMVPVERTMPGVEAWLQDTIG